MSQKAVFFDKDGTLVHDVPYNVKPNLIKLTEGASECLRLLRASNFKLFVITNQSGIARGFFAESDLNAVWKKLNELTGIEFDGFYYCPHYPAGEIAEYSKDCDCRKPEAGLILQAAREHNIILNNSWFIGDSLKDVAAGQRAGCQTILLDAESKPVFSQIEKPNFIVQNLVQAAQIILNNPNAFTNESQPWRQPDVSAKE
jgi:D,D-heptose 1,7-bisphosphate phosphatase